MGRLEEETTRAREGDMRYLDRAEQRGSSGEPTTTVETLHTRRPSLLLAATTSPVPRVSMGVLMMFILMYIRRWEQWIRPQRRTTAMAMPRVNYDR